MIILFSINSRYRYRKMKRRCCWETNSPKFVFFFHFGNNYCSQSKIVVHLLTYSPVGVLLETRRAVFWSLSGCQEIKHAAKPFTGPALGGLLISLGIRRKQSSEGFNSDIAVLTISFRFLSSPLLSLFLPCFFFTGHLQLAGFILARKVFGKAFRMKGKVGG